MRLSHRLLVTGTSIAILVGLALYPRSNQPIRTDPVSHGYQTGYGYGAPCPTTLTFATTPKFKVVSGQPFTAIGQLAAESGFNVAFQPIRFFQALFGQGSFSPISGVNTNAGGSYSRRMFPSKNATYKTQWGPLVGPPLWCPAVAGGPGTGRATILVYVRVPWLFGETPTRNDPVLVFGSVRPVHPGRQVVLEFWRVGDTTHRFRRATLDSLSNFFINLVFDRTGTWRLRVSYFDPDIDHEGNFLEKQFNVGP